MINTEVFEEIGFSRGEIKVYFALISLGETTIGPLAKKADVTPAKVYSIIEKLEKKGLTTKIIKSGTNYFNVVSPKQIIKYLDEKTKKIEQQKNSIKEIIPKLEDQRNLSKNIQKAEIYQTFNGLRTLYNEIIDILKKNKEDFIAFTLGEEEYKFEDSKYFFDEYDTKRSNAKIKIRLLGHISQKDFMKNVIHDDKNISIRYLDYKMPTGVTIYGDKVANIVWGEVPIAFVMQSKKLADSYKEFFEEMWKIAKK